jgi:septum formation protein
MMISAVSDQKGLYRSIESLVLASASPRREELLRSAGLSFDIVPSGIEETSGEGESAREMAKRWAMEKAMSVSRHRPGEWVLGADTIVVLEGTVFGKPTNHEEASAMLRKLSGRAHEVITGICLAHHTRRFTKAAHVLTEVRFRALSDDEIRAYVATGEPLDKAGAYGIQGRGAALVRSVQGSYTNVVGLPLCEVLEWLLDQRVIAPGNASSGS